jgi:hypothetical protein
MPVGGPHAPGAAVLDGDPLPASAPSWAASPQVRTVGRRVSGFTELEVHVRFKLAWIQFIGISALIPHTAERVRGAYCVGDRHPFPLIPAIVHGAHRRRGWISAIERDGNGYRYYYNGGKFLMDLPQFGSICRKD